MKRRILKQPEDSADLRDIALKLDQIAQRANQTGAKLEKIEMMKQQQQQQKQVAIESEKTQQTAKDIFDNDSFRPSRPKRTEFRAKKQRVRTKSKDVTIDQIFEALTCLREEINMLNENHDEMVQQINTIKSLIE
ncbi:hypothetical protein TRFO_18662 [Tritrichomonas foetus]|uniref:Uncharacterized protein n=1 Tax=Tritrichomonas foetus TaxID=1144522 RepID=A0A1J4KPZ9_9EUKA|nr:hypothetical protein TRFO_18662 [Tritrichomonas foetus]|eukprot:OHT11774.1 hypothetical protein TRFO_18662 [Tritrichomonas foetus]